MTSKEKISVAVVGASGYTGEELLRVLIDHPQVSLSAITSRQLEGKHLSEVLSRTQRVPDLSFKNLSPKQITDRAEVFFLALPHGVSSEFVLPLHAAGKTIFDLSADFRLADAETYQEFYNKTHPAPELLAQATYGSPEINPDQIESSNLIACPGCYPTSVLLALAPALKNKLIKTNDITINSLSGVSGAGKKAATEFSFCEINESMKPYSVPKHRHLPEIEQELSLIAKERVQVTFVPHLVPVHRGMLSTVVAGSSQNFPDEIKVRKLYQEFYKASPFVKILTSDQLPETKNVVQTNSCHIAIKYNTRTDKLIIMSAIDNLGKGAATQAVQCFNIRFGLTSQEGLAL
ncbi:MAG: N-acetyl-gamma-glutamyl-phosphate reductase [Verrucomicrobiota bacterium]